MNSSTSRLSLTVRRLAIAASALLLALTVAACGNGTDSSGGTPPTHTIFDPAPPLTGTANDPVAAGASSDDSTTDDGSTTDPAAVYQGREQDFYARFQYLANAPADLRINEHDIFVDGVFACQTFTNGSGAVEDVVATLKNNRGLTDDGAHAVAAAATEELCTDTQLTVSTRTETEASQISERVSNDLGGVEVREEPAMVDTKLACQYLDTHATADGLRATVRSEGEAFLNTETVSDQVLNTLIVDGVGIHCPANSIKLGPNFFI
jgi:hypothetical protein